MKKLLALLLLLSSCDSAKEEGEAPAGAPSQSAAAGAAPGAEDAARMQQRIQQSLAPILMDPASARYANVRSGAAGAVCGNVDAKQAGTFTGFRPFVITPDGVAVVSTASRVLFNDALDPFSDFYIRWCASPEELQRIGPEIAAAPDPLTDPGAAPPPDLVDLVPPQAPATPEAPAPEPRPAPDQRWGQAPKTATPAPKPGDDSFGSAVIRKREAE